MHYVSAENLSKSYGVKPLFQNLSFHVSEGDKIALVARNGSGKSTLLKIIAGIETPDEGKLWINKNVEVAFFEQDPKLMEEATVLDNIFHVAHPVMAIIKEYEAAVDAEDDEKIGNALVRMDEAGAWDFEAKGETDTGKAEYPSLKPEGSHLKRRAAQTNSPGQNIN